MNYIICYMLYILYMSATFFKSAINWPSFYGTESVVALFYGTEWNTSQYLQPFSVKIISYINPPWLDLALKGVASPYKWRSGC